VAPGVQPTDPAVASVKVDLVIPVLNEAHVLRASVARVHAFFSEQLPYRWRIVIAENGSTDGTLEVANELCDQWSEVDVVVIDRPGRGRALRSAWTRSDADVVSYTDVDLSTELEALPRLYRAILEDGYDVAVGSRLLPASSTTRSFRRQVISRGYNQILKLALQVGFSDAQTGCKAVSREVVDKLLPLAQDQGWFLDTELLVLAEKLGYRIADLPVVWVEDDDSRVKIVRTAVDDLRGVIRLRRWLRPERLETEPLSRARPSRMRHANSLR